MNFRAVVAVMAVTVLMAGTSRADFKYTQQSKVTGGTLASVSKSLGVFSKSAREATAPQTTTTMIHGNRLRIEDSKGMIEIIDLDARRFVHIDTAKKTYTIQTFEQLKQQIEQAQQKMKEEQTKSVDKKADPQTMTMVPKFDMQATGATHPVLDLPAKEMKMRVDLLFKSTDPKTEAELEKNNTSTWMTSDSWYGTVPGYEELRAFYMKMAKELNWLPGSVGLSNPQMGPAMDEFKKNSIKMDGMPLLQYTSFGLAGTGQDTQSADQPAQQSPPTADNSTPTSASGAIAKGLGGLFAKKKQQQADKEAAANAAPSTNPPPPPPIPGSLMDMTIQVTSYSKDSLDASLFELPVGYTEVQPAAATTK